MATITETIGKVGWVYKGLYDATVAYKLFDCVKYQGSLFLAKGDTTGNLPNNTTYWNQIVDQPEIADGSITDAKLADNSVTSAKIADGTIVNSDINASAAIDGTKLADSAISTAKLADSSVTNAKLGEPVSTANGGTGAVNASSAMENLIGVNLTGLSNNAGLHSSIYRGKYLGTEVTAAQYAAISSGTFNDLWNGDYWTINGINYRIAAFDYYYLTGDTSCGTHHIVLVPDNIMYTSKMNSTNTTGVPADGGTTLGAYVGSAMYRGNVSEIPGLSTAKTTINDAFPNHILTHRQYLANAANGYQTGGSWYDSTVELMTEQNVYGGKIFSNVISGTNFPSLYTIDKSQYPLFALNPYMISNRQYYWLRDVVSSTTFAGVFNNGLANDTGATSAFGVRPAFSICA